MPVNNAATISRESCTVYSVTNDEEEVTLKFTVSRLTDSTFSVIHTSDVIDPEEVVEYTIVGDGIYRIIVYTWQSETETLIKPDYYDIVVDCSVINCMVELIKYTVCNHSDDCCDDCGEHNIKVMYRYNSLMNTYYLYMMKLNGVYVNNWAYTELSDSTTIPLLASISDLQTQLSDHCACVTELTDGDCGCGG